MDVKNAGLSTTRPFSKRRLSGRRGSSGSGSRWRSAAKQTSPDASMHGVYLVNVVFVVNVENKNGLLGAT
jgi:hypothetical protein